MSKGKAGKTNICHYDEDEGTFKTISISDNALDAHKNHGDFVCDGLDNIVGCDAMYGCVCVEGYEFKGGDGCVDIDECATETDNCDANASCTNTLGSFECACNDGYSGDGTTCVDIDECVTGDDNCDANASCTNTLGSFECACNTGYSGDGETCVDIDECVTETDNCDANASCANTLGSFECECNTGYTGDGETCVDIDECATETDNCDANASCTNTVGSFECECDAGYSGDGTTCVDIDECSTGDDNCDDNATCTNTVGSFECECNEGYSGDGETCKPEQPVNGVCKTVDTGNGPIMWCQNPSLPLTRTEQSCNNVCNSLGLSPVLDHNFVHFSQNSRAKCSTLATALGKRSYRYGPYSLGCLSSTDTILFCSYIPGCPLIHLTDAYGNGNVSICPCE